MYSKDELKKLKIEFWESFSAYCEVQPYLRGRHKIWPMYNTKVNGVDLTFDVSSCCIGSESSSGRTTFGNVREVDLV